MNCQQTLVKMKNGFSLLELLFTLAITAIIAVMAYPNYQAYMLRAHRIDGQTALLHLANQLEHYYQVHHTYQTATLGTGKRTDVLNNQESPEHWYILSILKADDTSYLLQATPMRSQVNDTFCQSFTLDNLGIQDINSGPAGVPTHSSAECW
jgi:type IV pilus assembly protein PilE